MKLRMNKILLATLLLLSCLGLSNCSDDTPKGASIFPTTPVRRNAFDNWLLKNYTNPYNIEFKYRLEDAETDFNYHLVPADSAKTAKLAILTKYLWFDAYAEVAGVNFVKANVPRTIVAVGIPGYTRQRTMVLGSAEGGYKVTLNNINSLDSVTLTNYGAMTEFYFHTMHHEFTHILNQKKPYNTAFNLISKSDYVSSNWSHQKESDAHRAGFVSPYAMSDGFEDFAETLAFYVTLTPAQWNDILKDAGNSGAPIINQKLEIIKDYMLTSWNVDLDRLRASVLGRGDNVRHLDLQHLK